MKPQDLKPDDHVIFLHQPDPDFEEDYWCGSILFNFPEKQFVCVGYMIGYKYLTDNIDYRKLVAVGDEKNGMMMDFHGWKGLSVLITA